MKLQQQQKINHPLQDKRIRSEYDNVICVEK